MKVVININGKETEITLTKEQLGQIQEQQDPMKEVYRYHNTTKEQFDKQYENIPFHLKAYQKEVMVVEFYNKGWEPDWSDKNENKYYPYFYMNEFRLHDWDCYDSDSGVPARLVFKNKEDLKEAVEKFKEIFKESRIA